MQPTLPNHRMQDWPLLHRLWQRHCEPGYRATSEDNALWRSQVRALYANHIAHPVALNFLLQERPSLEQFRTWVEESHAQYLLLADEHEQALSEEDLQLSPSQLACWQENGYLVLPSVISAAACAESRAVVWDFLGASLHDPASWYSTHSKQPGLMLPLYNQVRLNTNRASRRVQAAYQQLYGERAIYKTIDHLSFNPPETEHFSFRGDGVHWDVSLSLPIPERYQGLLYLTDCGAQDGAFHCVPGFQHRIADWLASLPPKVDAREYAAKHLQKELQPVPGKAGDFVIWHQALPHCATANHGQTPRIVQYLAYIPVDEVVQMEWL
ncbi:MAG: phytanoyl-CoA dioxygenase family protein [Burkholderiales bacterium]|nr:phytanoyl-CoA dioxygenase family protein [Burkholderiales bacterium]